MKKMTNAWTYVLIVLLVVIFISAFQTYTSELITNSNSNLDDASIEYIAQINDIDLSNYSTDSSEIEDEGAEQEVGASLKDYALEFFYSRTIGGKLSIIIKNIFSLPEYIAKILNIPISNILWIIDILNWFWRLGVLLAIYFLIRGINT